MQIVYFPNLLCYNGNVRLRGLLMTYQIFMLELFKESNLSMEEWSRILDMSEAGIKKVLKGQVKNPSRSTIDCLADHLKISPIEVVRQMFFDEPALRYDTFYDHFVHMWAEGEAAQHYLSKLYLDGYNIIPNKKYQSFDQEIDNSCAGIAIKKREPNNTIHVFSIHNLYPGDFTGKEDTTEVLVWLLTLLVSHPDINQFKRVDFIIPKILDPKGYFTDSLIEAQLPLKFKMNLIHYDHEKGEVLQVVHLS